MFCVIIPAIVYPLSFVRGLLLGLRPRIGMRSPKELFLPLICLALPSCAFLAGLVDRFHVGIVMAALGALTYLIPLVASRVFERIEASGWQYVWYFVCMLTEIWIFACPILIAIGYVLLVRDDDPGRSMLIALPIVLVTSERVSVNLITATYRVFVYSRRMQMNRDISDDQKSLVAHQFFTCRLAHSLTFGLCLLYSQTTTPKLTDIIPAIVTDVVLTILFRSCWLHVILLQFAACFCGICDGIYLFIQTLIAPTSFSLIYSTQASVPSAQVRVAILLAVRQKFFTAAFRV